jgi:hypothetical protein
LFRQDLADRATMVGFGSVPKTNDLDSLHEGAATP